jgi:hypothetical protein
MVDTVKFAKTVRNMIPTVNAKTTNGTLKIYTMPLYVHLTVPPVQTNTIAIHSIAKGYVWLATRPLDKYVNSPVNVFRVSVSSNNVVWKLDMAMVIVNVDRLDTWVKIVRHVPVSMEYIHRPYVQDMELVLLNTLVIPT